MAVLYIGPGITIGGGIYAYADAVGQVEYTTPGTYSWTVPDFVFIVCAVCVGGGAGGGSSITSGGGGGGGLRYINFLSVTPGSTLTIVVGSGGRGSGTSGSESSISLSSTKYVYASGGITSGSGGGGSTIEIGRAHV